MKLKKNDQVLVMAGKDNGKKGKILKIFPKTGQAIVEGINMIKKHQRPSRENPKGGMVEREGKVNISNLKLICPKTGKPTRVGFSILADGTKSRISKVSQEIL
jgi:large subunit ribosomal protein L24